MRSVEANPIIGEIRRTRDELWRRAGNDVRKMMEIVRERERESTARGEKFVSFAKPRRPE
jgi:hypothetical protein